MNGPKVLPKADVALRPDVDAVALTATPALDAAGKNLGVAVSDGRVDVARRELLKALIEKEPALLDGMEGLTEEAKLDRLEAALKENFVESAGELRLRLPTEAEKATIAKAKKTEAAPVERDEKKGAGLPEAAAGAVSKPPPTVEASLKLRAYLAADPQSVKADTSKEELHAACEGASDAELVQISEKSALISDPLLRTRVREAVTAAQSKRSHMEPELAKPNDEVLKEMKGLGLIPLTKSKTPYFERLTGSPDDAKKLELEVAHFQTTGEQGPLLQQIYADAGKVPKGNSPEAAKYNDRYLLVAYLTKTREKKLDADIAATGDKAQKDALIKQKGEVHKQYLAIANGALSFEKGLYDKAHENARSLYDESQKARESGDTKKADELKAQSERENQRVINHDEAKVAGAKKLENGAAAVNQAALEGQRGYRLKGAIEIDDAERAGKPLKKGQVPALNRANGMLEEVPPNARDKNWKEASLDLNKTNVEANQRWLAFHKADPPPLSKDEEDEVERVGEKGIKDAVIAKGHALTEGEQQAARDKAIGDWYEEREKKFLAKNIGRRAAGGPSEEEFAATRADIRDDCKILEKGYGDLFDENAKIKNPSKEELAFGLRTSQKRDVATRDRSAMEARLKRDELTSVVAAERRRASDPATVEGADAEVAAAKAGKEAAEKSYIDRELKVKLANARLASANAKAELARDLDAAEKNDDPERATELRRKIAAGRAKVATTEVTAAEAQQNLTNATWFKGSDHVQFQIAENQRVLDASKAEQKNAEDEVAKVNDPLNDERILRRNASVKAGPSKVSENADPIANADKTRTWLDAHKDQISAQDRYTTQRASFGATKQVLRDTNDIASLERAKVRADKAEAKRQLELSKAYTKSEKQLSESNNWQNGLDLALKPKRLLASMFGGGTAAMMTAPLTKEELDDAADGTLDTEGSGVVYWAFDTKVSIAQQKAIGLRAKSADAAHEKASDSAKSGEEALNRSQAYAARLADASELGLKDLDATIPDLPEASRERAYFDSATAHGDLAIDAARAGRPLISERSLTTGTTRLTQITDPTLNRVATVSLAASAIETGLVIEASDVTASRDENGAVKTGRNGRPIALDDAPILHRIRRQAGALYDKSKRLRLDLGIPVYTDAMQGNTPEAKALRAQEDGRAESVRRADLRLRNAHGRDVARGEMLEALKHREMMKVRLSPARTHASTELARTKAKASADVSSVDGMIFGLAFSANDLAGDLLDAVVPDAVRDNGVVRDGLASKGLFVDDADGGKIKGLHEFTADVLERQTQGDIDVVYDQIQSSFGDVFQVADDLSARDPDAGRAFLSRALAASACDDPDLRASAIGNVEQFAISTKIPITQGLVTGTTPDHADIEQRDADCKGKTPEVDGASKLSSSLVTLSVQCPDLMNALLHARNEDEMREAFDELGRTMPRGVAGVLENCGLAQISKLVEQHRMLLTVAFAVVDLLPSLLTLQPEIAVGQIAASIGATAARVAAFIATHVPRLAKALQSVERAVAFVMDLAAAAKNMPKLMALTRTVSTGVEMWANMKLASYLGEVGAKMGGEGSNLQKGFNLLGNFASFSAGKKFGTFGIRTNAGEIGHAALWPALSLAYQHGIVANVRDPKRAAAAGEIGELAMIIGPAAFSARGHYEHAKGELAKKQFPNEPLKQVRFEKAMDTLAAPYRDGKMPNEAEVKASTAEFERQANEMGVDPAMRAELKETAYGDWATRQQMSKGKSLETTRDAIAADLTQRFDIPADRAKALADERMRLPVAESLKGAREGVPLTKEQDAAVEMLRQQFEAKALELNLTPQEARQYYTDLGAKLGLDPDAANALGYACAERYAGQHLAQAALGRKVRPDEARAMQALREKPVAELESSISKDAALAQLTPGERTQLREQLVTEAAMRGFYGAMEAATKSKSPTAAQDAVVKLASDLVNVPNKAQILERAAVQAFLAVPRPDEAPTATLARLNAHLEAINARLPAGSKLDTQKMVQGAALAKALETAGEKGPPTADGIERALEGLGVKVPQETIQQFLNAVAGKDERIGSSGDAKKADEDVGPETDRDPPVTIPGDLDPRAARAIGDAPLHETTRRKAIEELQELKRTNPKRYDEICGELDAKTPEQRATMLGMLSARRQAGEARSAEDVTLRADYPAAGNPQAVALHKGKAIPVFDRRPGKKGECEVQTVNPKAPHEKIWIKVQESTVMSLEGKPLAVAWWKGSHDGGEKGSGFAFGKAGEQWLVYNPRTREYSMMRPQDFHPNKYGISAVDSVDTVAKPYAAARDRLDPLQQRELDGYIAESSTATHQLMLKRVFALNGRMADVREYLSLVRTAFPPDGASTPEQLARLCTADGVVQYYTHSCAVTAGQYQRAMASPLEAIKLVALGREGILAEQTAGLINANAARVPRQGSDVRQAPGLGDGRVLAEGPRGAVSVDKGDLGLSTSDQVKAANRDLAPLVGGGEYKAVNGLPDSLLRDLYSVMTPPASPPPEGVIVNIKGTDAHARVLCEVIPAFDKSGKPDYNETIFVLRDPLGGTVRAPGRLMLHRHLAPGQVTSFIVRKSAPTKSVGPTDRIRIGSEKTPSSFASVQDDLVVVNGGDYTTLATTKTTPPRTIRSRNYGADVMVRFEPGTTAAEREAFVREVLMGRQGVVPRDLPDVIARARAGEESPMRIARTLEPVRDIGPHERSAMQAETGASLESANAAGDPSDFRADCMASTVRLQKKLAERGVFGAIVQLNRVPGGWNHFYIAVPGTPPRIMDPSFGQMFCGDTVALPPHAASQYEPFCGSYEDLCGRIDAAIQRGVLDADLSQVPADPAARRQWIEGYISNNWGMLPPKVEGGAIPLQRVRAFEANADINTPEGLAHPGHEGQIGTGAQPLDAPPPPPSSAPPPPDSVRRNDALNLIAKLPVKEQAAYRARVQAGDYDAVSREIWARSLTDKARAHVNDGEIMKNAPHSAYEGKWNGEGGHTVSAIERICKRDGFTIDEVIEDPASGVRWVNVKRTGIDPRKKTPTEGIVGKSLYPKDFSAAQIDEAAVAALREGLSAEPPPERSARATVMAGDPARPIKIVVHFEMMDGLPVITNHYPEYSKQERAAWPKLGKEQY